MLKVNNHLFVLYIIIIIFFYESNNLAAQSTKKDYDINKNKSLNLTSQDSLIKKIWKLDVCGQCNIRYGIVEYIMNNNYLINKDSLVIREIFGEPFNRYSEDMNEGFGYQYIIKAEYSSNGKCVDPSFFFGSLYIIFDKHNKVRKVVPSSH